MIRSTFHITVRSYLALLIDSFPNLAELGHEGFQRLILDDGLVVRPEHVHVAHGQDAREIKRLLQSVLLGIQHVLRGQGDHEMDGVVGVVLLEVHDRELAGGGLGLVLRDQVLGRN